MRKIEEKWDTIKKMRERAIKRLMCMQCDTSELLLLTTQHIVHTSIFFIEGSVVGMGIIMMVVNQ